MRTLIMKTKIKQKCLQCVGKFVIKYLFTNQNFHKSKLFREFNIPKKVIYVNKGILRILDNLFDIFNYLIEPNILQLVFDFITYSIAVYYVL